MTEQDALPDDFADRFSRQNAAFGAETTAKMTKLKILMVGARGLGIETAKNLVLQGIGGITICDGTPVAISDVGANFFLTPEDAAAGTPRATAIQPRLKELNPFCEINAVTTGLDEALVAAHDVVVVTSAAGLGRKELLKWDAFCRTQAKKITFIYGFCGGMFASLFSDHGDKHEVNDRDGERPTVKLISGIGADGLLRYETPEGQPVGEPPLWLVEDKVPATYEISEIEGMVELNGMEVECSHPSKDPAKTLRINVDTAGMSAYVNGGLLTQKKKPYACPSQSAEEVFSKPPAPFTPEHVLTDMINIGSELQTHVALQGMLQFIDENGRQPTANSEADAAAVVACAKALVASGAVVLPEVWGETPALDDAHLLKFARHCSVELQPMGAFLGGLTAQEVIKFTGKFTPLPSMMHFAALESLPEEQPSAEQTAPAGTRFDDLAAVYGKDFVETLGNLRYFMVGCGALGCEFLKNFALNNICCGQNGSLTVTDNDRIELSNLSRQFLFREHNVGQPKSRAAGVMAKQMNPTFHVESLEMFVGPNTEDTFDDDFWMGLDGVCNALDNMEARMYVDGQVVKYELPLLESGTMGTSGNVDPVVPFKTKSYEDGGKAAEDGGIPMCTLRNFPHLPDHCIEWARDQFEALFVKLGKQAVKYVDDPEEFVGELMGSTDKTQAIFDTRTCTSVLRACASPSVGAAAQLAFDIFHMLFRDKITDLTTAFPRDARTIDKAGVDKGAFWSGHKKFPTPALYDGACPAPDLLLSPG
jgi:ubiquitin-activating enzyme E1